MTGFYFIRNGLILILAFSCSLLIAQRDIPDFASQSFEKHWQEDDEILAGEKHENGHLKIKYERLTDSTYRRHEFFEDGSKKRVCTVLVVSGEVLHGSYMEYSETKKNVIRCKGKYEEGSKVGEWSLTEDDGTYHEAHFENDVLTGEYKEYYPLRKSKRIIKTQGQFTIRELKRNNINATTGETETTIRYRSVPSGNWLYFDEAGEFLKLVKVS